MRHIISSEQIHPKTEDEYFRHLDADLIDAMRRFSSAAEECRRMAEVSQIEHPGILYELQKLGYNHRTVVLLHLVPLVQIAWADGWVSAAERDQILALAVERGVRENTLAWWQLQAWLEKRPHERFFQGTWQNIEAIFQSMTEAERRAGKDSFIRLLNDFAHDTCQHLGWASYLCAAKRKLLHEFIRRLAPTAEAKVLARSA
jgi:hypothetical protein